MYKKAQILVGNRAQTLLMSCSSFVFFSSLKMWAAHIQKQKVCEFHCICILGQLAELSSRLPILAFEREKGKCQNCVFALGLVIGAFCDLAALAFGVRGPAVCPCWYRRLSGPFDSFLHQSLLTWTFLFFHSYSFFLD